MSQIADPEPGSFQHKAHVGLDETGNVVTEGEVDRKWSDTLGGTAPRPKVSFTRLRSELWVEVNIVVFFLIASAIFDDTRLEEAEKILAGLRSIQNI